MGITYQAQVEVYYGPNEVRRSGRWQAISRWELQKDYDFSSSFREASIAGWPGDIDEIIGEEEDFDPGTYDGKRYCYGARFAELDSEKWGLWAIHLQAFVSGLKDREVRVLVWQE